MTDECSSCGNGVVEANEPCDGDGNGNPGPTPNCNADCTIPSCGDGLVDTDAGEDCDGDGEGTGGETAECNDNCLFSRCGDGIINATAGETCDDNGESTTCDSDCTAPQCGDGVRNASTGEACDDAGNSETCDADCTLAECGDGNVNAAAGETCDESVETATCNANCTVAQCGDGTLNATAGETCDDAGNSATCDADCTSAVCGDGFANSAAGEDCDDVGESATCDADCTAVACGDGIRNDTAGEVCDGAILNGATCESLGFLPGGTLACDPTDCTKFDISECNTGERLQNDDGVCEQEVGCSSPDGTSGNPNVMAECFSSGLTPPFDVASVTYIVGLSLAPPLALRVDVYEWDGVGAPGTRIAAIPVGPGDLSPGSHSVDLPANTTVNTPDFCIGIGSDLEGDGYRLMKSQTATFPERSWLRAPGCGSTVFSQNSVLGFPGHWCITATVEKGQ